MDVFPAWHWSKAAGCPEEIRDREARKKTGSCGKWQSGGRGGAAHVWSATSQLAWPYSSLPLKKTSPRMQAMFPDGDFIQYVVLVGSACAIAARGSVVAAAAIETAAIIRIFIVLLRYDPGPGGRSLR